MYTHEIEFDDSWSIILYPEFIPMEDHKVNEKWENDISQLSDYLKDQNKTLKKLMEEFDARMEESNEKEKSKRILQNKNM